MAKNQQSAVVASKAKAQPTQAAKGSKTAVQVVTKVAKAPKATNGDGKSRTIGNTALSVPERRVAFVKALRQLKATSLAAAVGSEAIMAKSGLTRFDVYCQGYHANPLATNGIIGQTKIEGTRGLGYYLTAKANKVTDDQIKGLSGK